MKKRLTIKFLTFGTDNEFNYDDSYESFEDFQNKLIESIPNEWNEYKGIKLVYSGSIINKDNFYIVPDKGVLIAICTKTREQSTQQQQNANSVENFPDVQDVPVVQDVPDVPVVPVVPVVQDVQDVPVNNKKYSFDIAFMASLTFMSLIRENPALQTQFNLNFQDLLSNLQQSYFKDIFKQIIDNSDRLLQNGNITLQINGDSQNGGNVSQIFFNENDNENIRQMVRMGFEEKNVVSEYVKNNKNINDTLKKLMD
jgi:hypothetical protein